MWDKWSRDIEYNLQIHISDNRVVTASLLHSLSLLGTGRSESSVFHSLAEVMLFSVAWTSVKPLLSCGLRGFKLRSVEKGRSHAVLPYLQTAYCMYVLLFALEACCHWLWQGFLFLFSGCADRNGVFPCSWSSGKDVLLCLLWAALFTKEWNSAQAFGSAWCLNLKSGIYSCLGYFFWGNVWAYRSIFLQRLVVSRGGCLSPLRKDCHALCSFDIQFWKKLFRDVWRVLL